MKLMCELVEEVRCVSEAREDGKKDLYIEGIFMQSGVKNRNGRIYPTHILEKEANRYIKDKVETNRAYGELGHPQSPAINLDRVSHMIKELRQDGKNYIGKAKIMETPMGLIVKNLIEGGASLGVSTRGLGTLKANKNGDVEVQEDFHLATAADIVADPSAPEAFVSGIMENVEFWYDDKHKMWVAEKAKLEIEEAVSHREFDEEKALEVFSKYFNNLSELYSPKTRFNK